MNKIMKIISRTFAVFFLVMGVLLNFQIGIKGNVTSKIKVGSIYLSILPTSAFADMQPPPQTCSDRSGCFGDYGSCYSASWQGCQIVCEDGTYINCDGYPWP